MGSEDKRIGPVISTRIRLARNLKDYPFPTALTKEESKELIEDIKSVITESTNLNNELYITDLDKISLLDRQVLVEKHLMSPELFSNYENGALIINNSNDISIMINEEDHIRIQCMKKDFKLEEALSLAQKIDDFFDENIEYAFSEKLGYLTSCPTNVGTGLRASVMIHLPALKITGNLNKILKTINQLGLAVRGVYGEGSEFTADMFQISNQVTLGISEKEIIENISDITKQIIQKELQARKMLVQKDKDFIQDKVYRAFGILANARLLDYKECMSLLSDVRLGIDMDMIPNITIDFIDGIIDIIKPACLQKIVGEKLDEREKYIKRAEIIRDKLSKVI